MKLIQRQGCAQAWTKKERSQSDSDAARKHQITQSVRQHFLYFLLYLETVLSLMLPHLCTATRVRGTWRSLLGEKKHVERQSVSQTDRQTDRVHIVSSWRLRSGWVPVQPPLELSRVTFTLRQDDCRLMPNNRPNLAKLPGVWIHNHSLPPPPTCSGAPRVQSSSSSSNPTPPNN